MSEVSTNPVFSNLLSAAILLAVALCLLVTELKLKRVYAVSRLIAAALILLVVAVVLFRPTWSVPESERIALLTAGFDIQKVDSLRDRIPDLRIVSMPDAEKLPGVTRLQTINDLSDHGANIGLIVGQGLTPAAMELVRSPFTFVPSDHPPGIIQLFLPSTLLPNRSSSVQGVINLDQETKLVLTGPGGVEDSVTLNGRGLKPFSLRFTPRQAGDFLYGIAVGEGHPEEFPVTVRKEKQLSILMLQSYPTFETRQLKNYLGKYHKLLARYQPTKNRFRYEYINRGEQKINRLSGQDLQQFDHVIADADVIHSLSPAEEMALRDAIRSGLGLIIFFNEPPASSKNSAVLPFAFKNTTADTAHVTVGSRKIVLSAWPAVPRSQSPINAIVRSKARILAGYSNEGFGKIGFQLLRQTHRLMLRGDSVAYAHLWYDLITQTSASEEKKISITTPSFPVFPGDPLTIDILAPGEIPSVQFKGSTLPLKEDVLIDDIWSTKIWADTSGWHALSIVNDSTNYTFYVSRPGAWNSLSAYGRMRATAAMASSAGAPGQRLKQAAVPGWLIFSIFILSAAWLWIEPKL